MDEIQYVKNRKNVARTKRIEKYIKAHRPRILGLSGTFMDRSMRQGWHIIYWSLPYTMPLPRKWYEFNKWALAVEDDPYITGIFPGVLEEFQGLTETLADGVGRRIVETPGIVAMDADDARVSLSIEAIYPQVPEEILSSVSEMRAGSRSSSS
jgi:hypothetical protein